MPFLPESMVKSEAGQADEGYFKLALSLHTYLQQLSRAIGWLTRSIRYLSLNPLLCKCALFSSCLITRAGLSTILCMTLRQNWMVASIFLPTWIELRQNTFSSCAMSQCQHARPIVGLYSIEGAAFLPFTLVLLQNHVLNKDTRPGPPSTSRYLYPPVVVLQDFTTSPSFGDTGVWTRDNNTCNMVLNPLSCHGSLWATTSLYKYLNQTNRRRLLFWFKN